MEKKEITSRTTFHEYTSKKLEIPPEDPALALYLSQNPKEENKLREQWEKEIEEARTKESKETIAKRTINEKHNFLAGLAQQLDFSTITKLFVKEHPLWYDRAGLWWQWKNNHWVMIDETDLLNDIDDFVTFNGNLKAGTKAEILEGLRRAARKTEPEEPPRHWIQFMNGVYDLHKQELLPPNKQYFFTNPIPHNLGTKTETPIIDKIFCEWVGEERAVLLKQIAAYCLLVDYPIHRFFILIGRGLNGKGSYLRWLAGLLGNANVVSCELDAILKSRFESAKLYRKLLCQMGETNISALKNTSMLKKLTGGDLIGFEFKNKNPFDAYNYAKVVIATNSLPLTQDKTDGFYRRPLIVEFNKRFTEKKDIDTELRDGNEYESFCLQAVGMLRDLLRERSFLFEGSIDDRRGVYEKHSNPVERFISEVCERGVQEFIPSSQFCELLSAWAENKGYRELSHKEIIKAVTTLGYEKKQKRVGENNLQCILGLSILNVAAVAAVAGDSIQIPIRESYIESAATPATPATIGLESFSSSNSGDEQVSEKESFINDEEKKSLSPTSKPRKFITFYIKKQFEQGIFEKTIPIITVEKYCLKTGMEQNVFDEALKKLLDEGVLFSPVSGEVCLL